MEEIYAGTSGSWDGQKHILALVPEMRLKYIYNFSYVYNDNESYFTYSLYNPEIIYRLIIDVSGQIKQLSWLNASQHWNLFWSQPCKFAKFMLIVGLLVFAVKTGYHYVVA